MSIQFFPSEVALRANPNARLLFDHLRESEHVLGLTNALLFFNFPLFREEEKLLVSDLVLISPEHGVLLISTPSGVIGRAQEQLDGAFSQVLSRLVRYPKLRRSRGSLKFHLDACLWVPEGGQSESVVSGFASFDDVLKGLRLPETMPGDVFEELVSTLDGSKALQKPKERPVSKFPPGAKVHTIVSLEEEIRRFDRDQRIAYMSDISGLQRIQGLAGSGKTVVLALKAAMMAIRDPDAKIVVTFFTKSLYQHIKQLITRFYRMHEDRDPDWTKIQVLHAWGGATVDGLYYQTARRFGHTPLNFAQAQRLSSKQPFGAICKALLDDGNVMATYDYVLVDEAQDFPPEFMQLALKLAVDGKMVIAYDVFQTIFDVETPTAASLFGTDGVNQPHVEFEEEIVLHKCYRNPRQILVCAHAIGFGIYGDRVVQMLESKEHWEDFGYEVQGEIVAGQPVTVLRPESNSPSSIGSESIDELISCGVFEKPVEEVEFVLSRIQADITLGGVAPEDILVICADDRNSSFYFNGIADGLMARRIRVNNIHAKSFGAPEFQEEGAVTLSTIYKAKGNEAYCVYIVGIDGLFWRPSPKDRNRAFTAMTRTKGWLCVTGVGVSAQRFDDELRKAKANFPALQFVQPSEQDFVFMKRDLVMADPSAVDDEISSLGESLDPEEFEKILRKKLREVQNVRRALKRRE